LGRGCRELLLPAIRELTAHVECRPAETQRHDPRFREVLARCIVPRMSRRMCVRRGYTTMLPALERRQHRGHCGTNDQSPATGIDHRIRLADSAEPGVVVLVPVLIRGTCVQLGHAPSPFCDHMERWRRAWLSLTSPSLSIRHDSPPVTNEPRPCRDARQIRRSSVSVLFPVMSGLLPLRDRVGISPKG
jgi:hypothetical protein